MPVDEDQLFDLLYQTLETELGGVQIYEAAVPCARNDDLRQEWELIGEAVKHLTGEPPKVLRAAYKEVEEQEDEHLYHNTGWARELWIEGLGLTAVLPPPEEQKEVKKAIGAAR